MEPGSESTRTITAWWLWLQWVLASCLGMFIAFVGGFLLTGFVVQTLLGENADAVMGEDGPGFFIALTVVFAIAGAGMGFMQWLLLRRHVAKAGSWVLASSLGFLVLAALYGALSGVVSEVVNEVVHNALGGALAGILQWRILRRQVVRAAWWIVASSLAFVVAGLVNLQLGGGPVAMVVGIFAMASMTGAVIVRMLTSSMRDSSVAA